MNPKPDTPPPAQAPKPLSDAVQGEMMKSLQKAAAKFSASQPSTGGSSWLSDAGILNPERNWTYAANASASEQIANRAVLDAIALARHHENAEMEIAAIIQIAE
jgi:hypothetical protein